MDSFSRNQLFTNARFVSNPHKIIAELSFDIGTTLYGNIGFQKNGIINPMIVYDKTVSSAMAFDNDSFSNGLFPVEAKHLGYFKNEIFIM